MAIHINVHSFALKSPGKNKEKITPNSKSSDTQPKWFHFYIHTFPNEIKKKRKKNKFMNEDEI